MFPCWKGSTYSVLYHIRRSVYPCHLSIVAVDNTESCFYMCGPPQVTRARPLTAIEQAASCRKGNSGEDMGAVPVERSNPIPMHDATEYSRRPVRIFRRSEG